jgi:hypothetical protein
MWRHYLIGKKFKLKTNHCGLKRLFRKPTLNSRQVRWMKFLSEYDFAIKHIKGNENKVVDALNKRAHEVHVATINVYMNYMKDQIINIEFRSTLFKSKRNITTR